ncbi:MAG: nickel-dependent lactate racemase [SAR324 cluster bacterium]|nr:nickel-dependent lactate racemase [SAR324 cluster bacterium]
MKTKLQYGKEIIEVSIPSEQVDEIRPRFIPGLEDESAAFRQAVRHPIDSEPLKELIRKDEQVAVVIPDITRALPSNRLLPWLFEELQHVPEENFTIIIGTGTHRGNTPDEIEDMVGGPVAKRYRILNHNAFDPDTLEIVGTREGGRPILMNKEFARADRRIVMGFVEPHFMAGFSGGYKAIFPGIADIDSIMHYHRASVIQDPLSTWGVLENNPTQSQIQKNGSVAPVDFCINLTLNHQHQITRFFCGDVVTAHEAGCHFVKSTAMAQCSRPYPIVITSNSGFPLDQNLYQAVKGMSAAAQIVEQDGLILIASRCNDGWPDHGKFRQMLFDYDSPQSFLEALHSPGFHVQDQWQNQLLALIQLKARVAVFSELAPEEVKKAHMEPVDDLNSFIARELSIRPANCPIAVLPEGPMTIPYLK